MNDNKPTIPNGYKQPIEPDDTAKQEDAMADWTRSLIGRPNLTEKQQAVLKAISERRKNGS